MLPQLLSSDVYPPSGSFTKKEMSVFWNRPWNNDLNLSVVRHFFITNPSAAVMLILLSQPFVLFHATAYVVFRPKSNFFEQTIGGTTPRPCCPTV